MPPSRNLDEKKLEAFLGDDYNRVLTSIDKPPAGAVPPQACDLLPALEGSAGMSMQVIVRRICQKAPCSVRNFN